MNPKPRSLLARPPSRLRRREHANTLESLERRALLASTFFDGGGGDNQWNNPDNWYYHLVPTAQDDVSIGYGFDVVLTGAPAAVRTLSMWGEGTSLTLSTGLDIGMSSHAYPGTALNLQPGGTLDGAGDLTLHGALNWSGGAMRGAGRTVVAFGAHADITGVEGKPLSRVLRIEHSAQITAGNVQFDGGTLEIDPRATLMLREARLLDAANADSGPNLIDNAGRIISNSELTIIEVPLYQSGTLEVTGTLSHSGGGEATGTFEMFTTDSRLIVGGPGYTFGGGAKFVGDHTWLIVNGGTTNVAEPQELGALSVWGGQATFHDDITVSGTTHLDKGGNVLNLAGAVSNLSLLFVEHGAQVNLLGDGTHVLRASPTFEEWGRIDVGRESMIIDYAPGYNALWHVRSMIYWGYNAGTWDGSFLRSSVAAATGAAIGYAEASALFTQFPATFMGQPVDDTSILITYTRWGDANLDRQVNLLDFNMLASGFGATDAYWTQGDFNYDQMANLTDFNRLAGNFGQSVSPVAGETDELKALLA